MWPANGELMQTYHIEVVGNDTFHYEREIEATSVLDAINKVVPGLSGLTIEQFVLIRRELVE